METFTKEKPLVPDPAFEAHRKKALVELEMALASDGIDTAIVGLIRRFARIPYCFTIQSCHGHFVSKEDRAEIDVFSETASEKLSLVHYRIAYLALCVQNSPSGKALLEDLKAIAEIDPEYVQYGSSSWFWNRCPNVCVLQVEPSRSADQDAVDVDIEEARHLANTRDRFFKELEAVVARREVG